MDDRIRFTFYGRLDPASFRAFAIHRANRLGLGLALGDCSGLVCEMTVCGQGDLLDAFEMAMSLGPLDCVVLEIERQAAPALELEVTA